MRRRFSALPLHVLTLAFLWMAGCSEFPGRLVWQSIPPSDTRTKAGLFGVTAFPGGQAVAVGFTLPGNRISRAFSIRFDGTRWNELPVIGHTGESFRLTGCARAPDGTLWACGSVRANPDENSTARPAVYRLSGDTWNEVPIEGLENTLGQEFYALAAGPLGEMRFVGGNADGKGICIRFKGDHWDQMPLPIPPGGGTSWTLTCVGRSPAGTWYCAGSLSDAIGGAIFSDDGTGWNSAAPLSSREESISGMAFDATGALWIASNHPQGDSTQGTIFKVTPGGAAQAQVTRKSLGAFQVYAIGFDPSGNGWAVGGRAPDDPFFANYDGAAWVESFVDLDLKPPAAPIQPAGAARPSRTHVETTGGEIFAVSVDSPDNTFAVGHAEEFGGDGDHEFLPRLFRIQRVVESDRPRVRPPLAPF